MKNFKEVIKKIDNFETFKNLFNEFIDWRWIAAFLIIPTIYFILDIYIDYGWMITYYLIFITLIFTGFINFVKNKKLN